MVVRAKHPVETTGGSLNRILLFCAGLFLLSLVPLIGGCYQTDSEIIRASDAISLPALAGTYTHPQSGTTTISTVPLSRDYRFRRVSKKNTVSTGYLRAVRLRGDIYIVQVKFDNEPGYLLTFFRFTANSTGKEFIGMEANVPWERLEQLAKGHRAVLIDDGFGLSLKGKRGDIMSFLLAHRTLPLVEVDY